MIKIKTGNIFESKAQTIVNTVNCIGVMGKGIALEFKMKFPEMFRDYEERCKNGDVKLGRPYLYKTLVHPWILNFPTKDHWRSVSNLKSIITGLKFLKAYYKEWDIKSIAFPPLGCGYGQLEWRIVGPTLYRYLNDFDIDVELYTPYNTPHEELLENFLANNKENHTIANMPEPKWINPGLIAIVEILSRIESQPFHCAVGRTIFQKIAYVATEKGIETGFIYKKGSYGPFSDGLKEAEAKLINNGLLEEESIGRMIRIKVGKTYKDAKKSYEEYIAKWDKQINEVVDLFLRVNTHQAEVVATVLFASNLVSKKKNTNELDILHEVQQWKERRKPKLDDSEVALAIRNLNVLGWLNIKVSAELPLPEDDFARV